MTNLPKYVLLIISLLLFVCLESALGKERETIVCGLSSGYPPYQFKDCHHKPAGFDADVMRLVSKRINRKLVFKQMRWDDVVGTLKYSDKLDCVCGMEITPARKIFFDFTSPFYSRKIVVFIRKDNASIKTFEDLKGKSITGDRDSNVERLLKKRGLLAKIRLKESASKEESMKLLKKGTFVAMIAPKAVGLYLAHKYKVEVKLLEDPDPGSPVAIAVKKGNRHLLEMLEKALQDLIKEGAIDELYKSWFDDNVVDLTPFGQTF